MIAGEMVAADIELAVWKWAKADSSVSASVNGQIHFEVPGKTPPLPLITLYRIGGAAQYGEALIDDAGISFSCWGKPNDKASTARVAAVLRTAAFNLYRAPAQILLGSTLVTLHGAQVGGALWIPDPETGGARHVVDVVFTTTSVAV